MVAQPVPVYSMSCFNLPHGLSEHLNMLIRKFWWGCKDGQRKPNWVSWEVMTMPKVWVGWVLKIFELFNLSILARQSWRISKNPETLSARILKAVYFPECSLLEAILGSHPPQIWRAVSDGRDMLDQGLSG